MMREHGVAVDHSVLNSWMLKDIPRLEEMVRKRRRPAGTSWWIDEPCIKVTGERKYPCCAVNKAGQKIDFLLKTQRALKAIKRFPIQAINNFGIARKITMGKNNANTATILTEGKR